MESFAIINVIKKEFDRIRKSGATIFFYIALPVTLFLIFSAIYKGSLVHELPIAVVDFNDSELSHTITKFYESSSAIKIVKYLSSVDEIKREFRKGHIDGALYIPERLDETVKAGRQANIVFYINSTNIIKNNYLLNDGLKVIKTVSAGALLKKLRSAGLTGDQAMGIINPIKVETQVLYNSNYSYSKYLVPALTTFALSMIIMLVSCTLFNSGSAKESFNEIAETGKYSALRILAGRSLPHLFFYFVNILLMICIIFPLMNIDLGENITGAVLFTVFYACCIFFTGTAISIIVEKEMMATEATLFIITPSFLYSGLTFPLWGMPSIHEHIGALIPYTHFLRGLMDIYMMNLPFAEVLPEVLILGIFGIAGFAVSYFVLRLKLKKILPVK
jgi:ABC-2 type transport system permease protein